jgi:hypothetical protein
MPCGRQQSGYPWLEPLAAMGVSFSDASRYVEPSAFNIAPLVACDPVNGWSSRSLARSSTSATFTCRPSRVGFGLWNASTRNSLTACACFPDSSDYFSASSVRAFASLASASAQVARIAR